MDVLNYLEPKFHPILISGLGDIAIFAYKRRILYKVTTQISKEPYLAAIFSNVVKDLYGP